jgi:hypothetical protein
MTVAPHPLAAAAGRVTAEEALEIAADAYIYAYPLLVSELTRRAALAATDGARMNQFQHRWEFPDDSFTQVARPNADTLYSQLWYDVSAEPLLIDVPDSGGRYYLLPMLDLWTDVFASPGTRTTGIRAQRIVLAAAGWRGSLPDDALLIHSPTALGWIIGRTQTNGPADYANVHRFQDRLTAVPLSRAGGRPYAPPRTPVDPSWDAKTPPVELVDRMSAREYFGLFTRLMAQNPPHANDYAIVHRMARLGLVPGVDFDLDDAPPEAARALESAAAAARPLIQKGIATQGTRESGWRTRLSTIGTYGTDYRTRANVAYGGLGANPIEDAIYPSIAVDANGSPFSSAGRYVIHFAKGALPPVRAFWSLTLYDDRQLFAANPLQRYALGDRDTLLFNRDGSLDLYVQREPPGRDHEANWLPAPAKGGFTLTLRLYWPRSEALDGTWMPPPVRRIP